MADSKAVGGLQHAAPISASKSNLPLRRLRRVVKRKSKWPNMCLARPAVVRVPETTITKPVPIAMALVWSPKCVGPFLARCRHRASAPIVEASSKTNVTTVMARA